MADCTRYELPFDGVYLLVDAAFAAPQCVARIGMFVGIRDVHEGDRLSYVHIISKHAGGEIRGYVIHAGRLKLRLPCYTAEWPEMDRAVSEALGLPVVGFDGRAEFPSSADEGPVQLELFQEVTR